MGSLQQLYSTVSAKAEAKGNNNGSKACNHTAGGAVT